MGAKANTETWNADKLESCYGERLRAHIREKLPRKLGHTALATFLSEDVGVEVPHGTIRHWLAKQIPDNAEYTLLDHARFPCWSTSERGFRAVECFIR